MGDRARGGDGGASLVEIAVALALIAVGLGSLLSIVPPAMQAVVTAGHVGTATLLARQVIDLARGHPYEGLCELDTGSGFDPVPGHDGFSRRVVVTPGGCPPPPDAVTTVTVVVRAEATGVEMTLVTIRSESE